LGRPVLELRFLLSICKHACFLLVVVVVVVVVLLVVVVVVIIIVVVVPHGIPIPIFWEFQPEMSCAPGLINPVYLLLP